MVEPGERYPCQGASRPCRFGGERAVVPPSGSSTPPGTLQAAREGRERNDLLLIYSRVEGPGHVSSACPHRNRARVPALPDHPPEWREREVMEAMLPGGTGGIARRVPGGIPGASSSQGTPSRQEARLGGDCPVREEPG